MSAIKFVARQAISVNIYKNLRSKTLKCNANIYFNKQCLLNKVIPKHAIAKFADTSPAAQVTTKKAQITRVKSEIKFLFKKKTQTRIIQGPSKSCARMGECLVNHP
jgi:hypothetical protein